MTQTSQSMRPSLRPGQPGQMTAVMRAVSQQSGPKVLRIGVVQSGKVIDDRIIRNRGHVTVGPSENAMFAVASKTLPPTFKLFEQVGEEYMLNFLDGMGGRVALRSGMSDVNALKGQAKRVMLGNVQVYQVPLTDEARGKISIGETQFLFHFVAPPPAQPRPQLPVSVKAGLAGEIDWNFTIIAAFSFLLHFGAVGATYTDWMDAEVKESENVLADLVDSLKRAPPPPPKEEPKKEDETKTADTKTADAPKQTQQSTASNTRSSGTNAGKAGPMSDQKARALGDKLERSMSAMDALLSTSSSGATAAVTGSDGQASLTGDLAREASSNTGTGLAGMAGGGGGGLVRPGEGGSGSLTGIRGSTSATAVATGTGVPVVAPKGNVSASGQVTAGSVSNAGSVVAGMQAGFRSCYKSALKDDPSVKGSARITLKIGPAGEVQSASISGGLPGGLLACLRGRAQSAQFAAPSDGGSAVVVIPINLSQ
jgi:hypothetical protein